MSLHKNTGRCEYCQKVFDRYPGFHPGLRAWFEGVQNTTPDAHISCAGRGRMDQEAAFHRRASKAHYGQSSHNFNSALDIFREAPTVEEMYDAEWFSEFIQSALTQDLDWYGAPGAKFFELPHVEIRGWEALKGLGEITLVEK